MKRLLKHITITAIIYLGCYLIYTFTVWEFKNPFLWIINIGELEPWKRFWILIAWIEYHVLLHFLTKLDKPNP